MTQNPKSFATIDAYIRTFPKEVQGILKKVKLAIKQAAPKATETISYQIPTFKLNSKYLVYFAGWKKHISLYPASSAMVEQIPALVPYRASKGTIKFPLDKPVPLGLIKKIVRYRAKEILAKSKGKY